MSKFARIYSRILYVCPIPLSFRKNIYDRQKKGAYMFKRFGLCLGLGYLTYEYVKRSTSIIPSFHDFSLQVSLPKVNALQETDEIKSNKNLRKKFNFLADVAEKTSPCVVYIEMVARHPYTMQSIPISNGSGFIIKSDGLILTNAHVVQNYGHVRVIVKLFNGIVYEGRVENYDTQSDLATVRIKANNLPVLPLGKSSSIRAGEFVIAMGNPLTLSHTITAGVVSSPHRAGTEIGLHKQSDYIQTDAAINVGNSGGPLVNLDCEAIGINTIKVTEGISFAIPSDIAREFLNRIESSNRGYGSNKYPATPRKQLFLGITMLTLSPSIISEMKERNPEFPNVTKGVLVWRVMINSPSYEVGINPGDVITAINGKSIDCANDVYNFLQSDDNLCIHIIRGKNEFDVTVKPVDPVFS